MRTHQQLRALGILALALIVTACSGQTFSDVATWLDAPVDCPISDSSTLGVKQTYGVYNPRGGEPRHTGKDFACPSGTEVHAVADGTVVMVGIWQQAPGYGLSVIIRHGADDHEDQGQGVYTLYAHGSEVLVTPGQRVTKRQVVMLSGCSGISYGCHLHFGVSNQAPEDFDSFYEHADERLDGRGWVDPDWFLGKPITPSESKLPAWVEMLPSMALLLFCVLPLILLIIAWQFRKDKVAEAVIWVADNGDMIKRALVIGLKDALSWWIFVITGMVVLSPQVMMIIRHGMDEWLADSSTIENWRIAILAIALLANLILRAVLRARSERFVEQEKLHRRTSWGRAAVLSALIGIIGATGVYAIKHENTSVSSTIGQSYFSDFPEVTYWNGAKTTFYLPEEIDAAVDAAEQKYGCDPKLVVAVAFSESPQYNNSVTSVSGAQGVWQFMPATWASYWPGVNAPSRTNVTAAADAACRMIKNLRLAEQDSEQSFVSRFTGSDGGQCWNCADTDGSENDPAVKQARFAWRLWKTLEVNKEVTIEVNP